MTTSNGFPVLSVHDLADAWTIGNMALAWAKEPLALTPAELERFNDLCHRYALQPSEVLYAWQKIAFPELLQRKLDASREAAREMPDVSGGGVPYPPRQDRSDAPTLVQSTPLVPGPALGLIEPPPEVRLPEGNCERNSEQHPDHRWVNLGENLPHDWYYCDGQPFVEDREDK